MRFRWIFRTSVIAAIAAAAIWLVHFLLFTKAGVKLTHSNVRQLSEYLRSFGVWSYLLGIGAVLLQTFVPFLPFFVIAGANVIAFGLVKGFLINYITAIIGAVIVFLFARYAGRSWVERKLSRYPLVTQFNRRLESHGFLYVLLGRLVPVIPSTAINLGAGVTKVRFNHFVLGTMLGKLPIIILESFIGNDLLHIKHNRGRLLVLLVIFAGLLLLSGWLKNRLFAKSAEAVQPVKEDHPQ